MNPAPRPAPPARTIDRPRVHHAGRHAATWHPYGEPTDSSAWATAYSEGVERARRVISRSHPESHVERRGSRRRRERA